MRARYRVPASATPIGWAPSTDESTTTSAKVVTETAGSEIVDETPEQILARLQRHADSLKARNALLPPTAVAPAAVAPKVVVWEQPGARDLLPEAPDRFARFGILTRTVAGQVVGVLACVIALIIWMGLSPGVAFAVVGVAIVGFAFAAFRRVPLCGWCTIGLLTGLVLGRFS